MNSVIKILILAIIGGLTGYITNVIAIKLIFRPIIPIKIPIINKEIIGLIPKRKTDIATNIGTIIQEEFLSLDEILDNIVTEDDKQSVVEYIRVKLKLIINEKLSLAPSSIKRIIQEYIYDFIEEEIKHSIDDLSEEIVSKATTRINIKEIVENKINQLDLYELENIILRIAKNELKHIEILGLVLGILIGIIQGIIILFI